MVFPKLRLSFLSTEWQTSRWARGFRAYCSLQLFLTVISLPICAYWGLPWSILSPVGNWIFAPFLSLFLMISTAIFFTHILHIPNGILITSLEMIQWSWNWCLSWATDAMLIGFVQPSLPFTVGIIIIAFVITLLVRQQMYRIGGLAFLFVLTWCILRFPAQSGVDYFTLQKRKSFLHVIHDHGKICVIDNGVLSCTPSGGSLIQYELMQTITKKTGCTKIDYFLLLRPRERVFQAVYDALMSTPIRQVWATPWSGKIPYPAWKLFRKMCECAALKKCVYKKIPASYSIQLPTTQLQITTTGKMQQYQDASYPHYKITLKKYNEAIPIVGK